MNHLETPVPLPNVAPATHWLILKPSQMTIVKKKSDNKFI